MHNKRNQYRTWFDGKLRKLCILHCALCISVVLFTSAAAQPESAPPPLKMMSKAERAELKAEPDGKRRTKLIIRLMEARVERAERLSSAKDHAGAFREFGAFHALMDDGLDYLYKINKGKDRTLDNFKRIEIALRGFATRIQIVRAEMPPEYDDYLRSLLKNIRDARTRASEPLFGDSVMKTSES